MAFDFSYPNTPADQRGWGPGWPNCQDTKMISVSYPSFSTYAQIRPEVHDLLVMLLTETEDGGYVLDGPVLDDWAFVCRPTKRADGTYTTTPSNHSWGLAVDLNSTRNVYGGGHDMPQWVADLWRGYGWRWLGPPIQDWAHFDFCGTPADAKTMTDKARKDGIGMALSDADRKALDRASKLTDALIAGLKVDGPLAAANQIVQTVQGGGSPAPAGRLSQDEADGRYARKSHDHEVRGRTA